jgi:hypothetical protein
MSPQTTRSFFALVFLFSLTALTYGQEKKGADDQPALTTASGVVDKADKDSVVIKPRGPDGKFQKTLTLKVTGTSKVTILTPQKRGDKIVLTQRDVDAKDLTTGQAIAVIYAEAGKDGPVLLTGVAQPATGK